MPQRPKQMRGVSLPSRRRLRRWDDAAKDPAARPPAFGYYQPMLRHRLRDQASRAAR